MNKKYFISDNLSFVATAVLQGGVTIRKIIFHSEKLGVKNYYLTPYNTVHKLYLEYVSDKLQISPSQLSAKIASLKGLQAEIPQRGGLL